MCLNMLGNISQQTLSSGSHYIKHNLQRISVLLGFLLRLARLPRCRSCLKRHTQASGSRRGGALGSSGCRCALSHFHPPWPSGLQCAKAISRASDNASGSTSRMQVHRLELRSSEDRDGDVAFAIFPRNLFSNLTPIYSTLSYTMSCYHNQRSLLPIRQQSITMHCFR